METQTVEKLTIAELAAHLPYQVEVLVSIETPDHFASHKGILRGIVNSFVYLDCKHPDKRWSSDSMFRADQIKPILHPLSSLTKEIEHGGESFVPMERLSRGIRMQIEVFDMPNVDDMKVADFRKLISWHFDCYNLIDRGLAVAKE